MDLKQILYVNANTWEIAAMANSAMKNSKNLAKIMYNMNFVNSRKTKLGREVVRDFFETSNCYDKKGNVTAVGGTEAPGVGAYGKFSTGTIEGTHAKIVGNGGASAFGVAGAAAVYLGKGQRQGIGPCVQA